MIRCGTQTYNHPEVDRIWGIYGTYSKGLSHRSYNIHSRMALNSSFASCLLAVHIMDSAASFAFDAKYGFRYSTPSSGGSHPRKIGSCLRCYPEYASAHTHSYTSLHYMYNICVFCINTHYICDIHIYIYICMYVSFSLSLSLAKSCSADMSETEL